MAASMTLNQPQHSHGAAPNLAITRRALKLLGALAALAMASACASTVHVAANGKSWGAPVSAGVRLATSGQYRRHHHARSGRAAPAPGAIGTPSGQKIGRPYQVAGRTYVPARQDDYDRTGVASWYGPKFHGRRTANGEHFDMNALSAAHTTLPLPSLVRVTNLGNGRSIIVRVNDRGPFVNNRLIDLSRAAAQELGYLRQGTARVRVQYVGPAVTNPAHAQVRRTASNGHDARIWPSSAQAPTPPHQGWRDDFANKNARGSWFVQAGAFSERKRARRIASDLRRVGKASVQKARVNRRTIHRVLVGPYRNRQQAENQRRAVAAAGYPDARVTMQR